MAAPLLPRPPLVEIPSWGLAWAVRRDRDEGETRRVKRIRKERKDGMDYALIEMRKTNK